MHEEILSFLAESQEGGGGEIPFGLDVIEVGSMILHDQPKARDVILRPRSYLGIDWRAGPGVDVVGLAHEALPKVGRADLVLCCQMLEHDPHWKRTVAAVARTVRPCGWALLTWAGPGYPEHEIETAPPDQAGSSGYYQNRTLGEVAGAFIDALPGRRLRIESRYARGTLDALLLAHVLN